MEEIIKSAVEEGFDRESLKEAIAYHVDDFIDYDEIARALLRRNTDLQDTIQQAALDYAEALL